MQVAETSMLEASTVETSMRKPHHLFPLLLLLLFSLAPILFGRVLLLFLLLELLVVVVLWMGTEKKTDRREQGREDWRRRGGSEKKRELRYDASRQSGRSSCHSAFLYAGDTRLKTASGKESPDPYEGYGDPHGSTRNVFLHALLTGGLLSLVPLRPSPSLRQD